MTNTPPRRLLWIVNHKTLLPAEVPILRELGWEVFIPKRVPSHDPGFRSAAVSREYDASLALPPSVLDVLNRHEFYERAWSPTVRDLINRHFEVAVVHFSYYVVGLVALIDGFAGRIVVRPFGRESPKTYTEFVEQDVLDRIAALGDRFVFGQGYDNLAEIEAPELARRAHTITVPLPDDIYRHANTWTGGGDKAVFLCPAIQRGGYYGAIYERIKRDFRTLPHVIFGRQVEKIDDPAILPYLTDDELVALYAAAPVFVYPHTEPRHVHYSPLEAIVVGTPTLYLRSALLGMLKGGADLPGACADIPEMRAKAERLLAGDRDLAEAIRARQGVLLAHFSRDLARRQWRDVLGEAG
jgi:hypothetical protein